MSGFRSRGHTTALDMPYGHFRYIYHYSNGHHVDGTTNCGLPSSYGPFSSANAGSDAIDDYQTPPGVAREVNPCTHTRTMPSVPWNVRNFTAPSPSYPTSVAINEIGPPVTYSGGTLPTIPWASMIADLSGKLNGTVSQGSLLAVTALEAVKTIQMLRNPFGLLKPDWRKRSGRNSLATLLKKGANLWLEGIYGWKAAYIDTLSIAKTVIKLQSQSVIDELATQLQRLSVCSTTVQGQSTLGSSQWLWQGNGGPACDLTNKTCQQYADAVGGFCRVFVLSDSVVARVGCRQANDSCQRYNHTMRFLNAYGLDGASVADVLWEIAPFSFVVDWFVDPLSLWKIPGSLLRLGASDVRDLCFSTLSEGTFRAQYWHPQSFSNYFLLPSRSFYDLVPSGTCVTGSSIGRWRKYVRNPGLPVSDEIFHSALRGAGLSTLRGISGASLLLQKFLR